MRAPGSIMERLAALPGFRHAGIRWTLVAVALIICGLLAVFPREHRASALLAPAALADIGLGSTLGQPSAVTGIFGVKTPAEIGLAIARSAPVRERAAKAMAMDAAQEEQAVIVRSARGGLVLVEAQATDPGRALALVAAHVAAMHAHLAALSVPRPGHARAAWQVIDPPHGDSARPVNPRPLAIGALILLLALVPEAYRRRPPVGARLAR